MSAATVRGLHLVPLWHSPTPLVLPNSNQIRLGCTILYFCELTADTQVSVDVAGPDLDARHSSQSRVADHALADTGSKPAQPVGLEWVTEGTASNPASL